MDTPDKDNTLKILTALCSVMFLLIALRTAYVDFDESTNSGLFLLNILWIFSIYEIPFLMAIYVAGPMVTDAMPTLFEIGRNYRAAIKRHFKTETNCKSVITEKKSGDTQMSVSESQQPTELSEEITSYITKTFENLLTPEQIEKLLDNFRNLNKGKPYEVVEKKKLQGVFEFDLIHFAWNVCKRIHDPASCPKIFGFATAELVKESFPLTLQNYSLNTIKCRLKDSEATTKFRLKIIDVGQPLTPFIFPQPEER